MLNDKDLMVKLSCKNLDFNDLMKLIIEVESFQFEDGNDISVQIGGGNYCIIKDA